MVWKNGTNQYMNAYNVFWENGVWKNGNWFGSFIQFDEEGEVTNDFHKQLLFRGMNWNGTASSHVWNIFESSTEILSSMSPRKASQIQATQNSSNAPSAQQAAQQPATNFAFSDPSFGGGSSTTGTTTKTGTSKTQTKGG